MILAGYDPVAGKVVLEVPGLPLAVELAAKGLVIKFWADSGMAIAVLTRDGVEVEFVPVPDEPIYIHLHQLEGWRWRVDFREPGTFGPG